MIKPQFILSVLLVLATAFCMQAQEIVWQPKTYGDTTLTTNPERQILKNGFPRFMVETNFLLPNYFGESNTSYNKDNYRELGVEVGLKFPVLFHRWSPKAKAALLINGTFRHVDFTYVQTTSVKLNFFDRNEFYYSLGYGLVIGSDSGLKFMVEPVLGVQSSFRLKTVNITFDELGVQEDYFLAEDLSEVVYYKGLFFKLFVSKGPLFDRQKEGLSESIPLAVNFGISHQKNPRVFRNTKYKEETILLDGTTFTYPHQLFYYHLGLNFMF